MEAIGLNTQSKPIRALYDGYLLVSLCGLLALGLLMVASTSIVISEHLYNDAYHYLLRQVMYLALGILMSYFVMRQPTSRFESLSYWALLLAILLLLIVLMPGVGHRVNGSMRWAGIGPFRFQVSEGVKLLCVIYLAGYLTRCHETITSDLMAFLRPLFIMAIISFLLLLQPDFGAAVVVVVTALSLLFLSGVHIRQFIGLVLIIAVLFAFLAVSAPYRLHRLTSFMNPWAHPFASGYQLTQSLIAFGRGGWLGVGLGGSIQKLFYLPEAHTDFIFSVFAEEIGFVGVVILFMMYSVFIIRGFMIGRKAWRMERFFCAYVVYGICLSIGLQFLINVGVCVGVLPTKGLTLPFISYGGSSLLINLICASLIFRVDYELRLLLLLGSHQYMKKAPNVIYRKRKNGK